MLTHVPLPLIPLRQEVAVGIADQYESIDVPTIKVNTLDMCYAHALLDRVFVWYWLIEDIKSQYPQFTHFNLLIGKDAVDAFPQCMKTIDVLNKCYKGIWYSLSRLIPQTSIIFEHLIDPTIFKTLFEPPYEDQWQRTPWNCELYYPYRNVRYDERKYSDSEIYSRLWSFRELILNNHRVIPTNRLIIIDRKYDRKFNKDVLDILISEASKNIDWVYDGVKILEDMTFKEQVELFASVKIIIAMHGSALINLLWSPLNTIVFEIDIHHNRQNMYKRIAKLTNSSHFYLQIKSLCVKSDIFDKIALVMLREDALTFSMLSNGSQ